MAPRRLWAGLVLACLCAGARGDSPQASKGLPLPEHCISGYSPQEASSPAGLEPQALTGPLPTPLQQWLQAQRWQAGYRLWQLARRCQAPWGTAEQAICGQAQLTPSEALCQGPQDGLAFLAMHRYLLTSLRATWPGYREPWLNGRSFPTRADVPAALQDRFTPWPLEVLRAAQAVERMAAMPRAQVLARWPTEGAFGQWLQCGSTAGGIDVNSLYGALLDNPKADSNPFDLANSQFWQRQAWIDRAWDSYRKKIGKTPDDPALQAELIGQCQRHSAWMEQAPQPAPDTPQLPAQPGLSLFSQGQLSPRLTGRWLSLPGEVSAVINLPSGAALVQLDLHLQAARPIWFASLGAINPANIKPGAYLRVAGFVAPRGNLDPVGQHALAQKADHLIMAESIQTMR